MKTADTMPLGRAVGRIFAGLLAVLVGSACTRMDAAASTSGAASDPVVMVPTEDAAMNAAMLRAVATVDRFIAMVQNPPSPDARFSVKRRFTEGTTVEHMWLVNVHYENGTFTGILDSEPRIVVGAKPGQSYSVKAHEISDWMVRTRGRMRGAYTVRALLGRMPEDQKREFEAQLEPAD